MKNLFSGKYSFITWMVIGAAAMWVILYFMGTASTATTSTTASASLTLPAADAQ